ncbi:MAG: hypothetical protein CVU01_02695 [Bacteroidetes bacterium HGW-Bacteroidetes-18]|nr:MAG: hypothetical protein CVU01_02695 [Bacteroidetes bacterium HGW-Bacteroidetes-18]
MASIKKASTNEGSKNMAIKNNLALKILFIGFNTNILKIYNSKFFTEYVTLSLINQIKPCVIMLLRDISLTIF